MILEHVCQQLENLLNYVDPCILGDLMSIKAISLNAEFLFCQSLSTKTNKVGLHLESWLCESLSLPWLLERRGVQRVTKAEEKKREKERGEQRRGGAASTEEISSEHSSAEQKELSLKCQREKRQGGQSQTVSTKISYSACLIRSWWEQLQQ